MKPKTETLDEIAAQETPPTDQVVHLRKQIAEMDKANKNLRDILAEQQEFAEACCASVAAAHPFPAFKLKHNGAGRPVTAVIVLSDWHIGERTNPQETEGFGRYSYAIAERRIFGIVAAFLAWIEVQRKSYPIDRIAALCVGDYVSGDIHGELLATNEFPLPEQTAKAGLLLGEVLRRLAGHCKRLDVFMVGADNHGRLQKKPQAKQKTSNNMSFLVHELAMSMLRGLGNIGFTVAKGAKLLCPINGFKFLTEHGDLIKGQLGFPYYGFGRMQGREATRRMNLKNMGFHYTVFGHWHVPAIIGGNMLTNGSLSGTSEFDHCCARHAAPSQVAFLVHPEHGMFNWVPFTGKF